ncbi:MAG: hypothetical protein K5644_09200 [Lachnospiraceae bacterium]|nr:hypothetical protein [Lachnospiraceae bacterium]
MRIALCDFDDKYLNSLLSYLYGKCESKNFASFTTIEDYEAASNNNQYEYTIMADDFYEKLKVLKKDSLCKESGKLIILSATIDNLQSEDAYSVIYKYGPMDGLYRMMEYKSYKASDSRKYAVYSPSHHELTEMYGLSMCQMFRESKKVLLIDTMHCPIVKKLIRDGPRGGLIDVIYKLENDKSCEIENMIEEYSEIDVLPLALNPMDVASIKKEQWRMLIDYVDSLKYEVYVFLIEDINQGFKEIMNYVDNCILINKRGDYYKETQDYMKEYIRGIGTSTTSIELLMSANNLSEGCYQLEELLTGNLGRYVRSQNYSVSS